MRGTVRHLLKRWFGRLIARVVLRALRLFGARLGVALVYHRVGDPPGDPATELTPRLGMHLYERQLDLVLKEFAIVPAADLQAAAAARVRGARFPLALTFDDDLPDHARIAAPALARRRLPAAFFLSGAFLAGQDTFWWQNLQLAMDSGVAARVLAGTPVGALAAQGGGAIHRIGAWIETLSVHEQEDLSDRLRAAGGDPTDGPMRADDVRALVAGGFVIGFHTMRHHALPRLDEPALRRAMYEGRDVLERLAGPIRAIAYPFGYHDARVVAAAREAGFSVGFTTAAEVVAPADDPLRLGRVEASTRSLGEFAFVIARVLARGCLRDRRGA
jgi:peptidoglycan/xylan/chitin deacetylase (PgdA/CDA1 family)